MIIEALTRSITFVLAPGLAPKASEVSLTWSSCRPCAINDIDIGRGKLTRLQQHRLALAVKRALQDTSDVREIHAKLGRKDQRTRRWMNEARSTEVYVRQELIRSVKILLE